MKIKSRKVLVLLGVVVVVAVAVLVYPAWSARQGDDAVWVVSSTDGTPVWTVPDLLRVGFTRLGREPARPPRALHTTSLVAVQDRVGWHLVAAGTGERVVDIPDVPVPEGDIPSVPIPTGDLAVYDTDTGRVLAGRRRCCHGEQ